MVQLSKLLTDWYEYWHQGKYKLKKLWYEVGGSYLKY